jgi:hypothetical protein
VSLYAFDGSAKVHFVADYARDARAEPDEQDTSMDRLLAFSRRDSSSSLYSAVLDGAEKLSASLAAEGRPIQKGTVVVIALNPDLAGRVNDSKVRDFVASSAHHYLLMTVGTWTSGADVSFIGKNGVAQAASVNTLASPFETLASAVDDDYFRNYLVSYCSPARAGTRELRLEVATTDAQGKKSIGRYDTEFDASGFGPGCNPLALPHLVAIKDNDARVAAKSSNSGSSKPSAKKGAAKSAAAAPTAESGEKVSSAAAASPAPSAASAGGAPIAEPPSGLGYE